MSGYTVRHIETCEGRVIDSGTPYTMAQMAAFMGPGGAIDLNNDGLKLSKAGRYQEAHDKFQRCIQMKEKQFGKDSIQVALTVMNLGDNYLYQGKLDEAEQCARRALAIRTAHRDPEAKYARELLADIEKARAVKGVAKVKGPETDRYWQPMQASSGQPSTAPVTKKCNECGATRCSDGKALLKCANCSSAYYCSKKCQRVDYRKAHKQQCKK